MRFEVAMRSGGGNNRKHKEASLSFLEVKGRRRTASQVGFMLAPSRRSVVSDRVKIQPHLDSLTQDELQQVSGVPAGKQKQKPTTEVSMFRNKNYGVCLEPSQNVKAKY